MGSGRLEAGSCHTELSFARFCLTDWLVRGTLWESSRIFVLDQSMYVSGPCTESTYQAL